MKEGITRVINTAAGQIREGLLSQFFLYFENPFLLVII